VTETSTCSGPKASLHETGRRRDRLEQPPDPAAWSRIGDPIQRLQAGRADLYRFYRVGAGMLANVYRDFGALPETHQQAPRDWDIGYRDVLVAPFGGTGDQQRRTRAVIGTPPRPGPGGPYAPASASRTKKQSRS
jgi:hypothetical protein